MAGAAAMKYLSEAWTITKTAAFDWMEDRAAQLGAALAFYSVLSLAPLLVIAVSVAGFVFGQEAARGELDTQIEGMVGPQGATAVEDIIENANQPAKGTLAAVLSVVMLIVGATGVFGQLQTAMNTIWEVEPKKSGIWGMVRQRFLSFSLVLGVGFLLLISLVLSALIAGMSETLAGYWPNLEPLWHLLNAVVSFIVVMLLFAMIFKFLPDTHVAWRDVWIGAAITAVLFTIGKLLIGLYLGKSSVGSAYGAAGSLVVLLVWIYYSAQIVFFGAEITQVWARRHGSRIGSDKKSIGKEPKEGSKTKQAPNTQSQIRHPYPST
jgi:membrane protein